MRSTPAAQPTAGVGRPAELLDEPVVAATATDPGLGAEPVAGELEDRARVVVEAAHQRRRRARRRARPRRAARGPAAKCSASSSSRLVEHRRRRRHHRAGALVVGVEGAQRVGVDALADVLRELAPRARAGGRLQLLAIARRATRGDPRLPSRSSTPGTPSSRSRSSSSTISSASTSGRVGADRLGADLVELAKAPGLRALVAKERAPGTRASPAAGSVCIPCSTIGAADRRRALGAQGDAAPALVLEAEHLLADDVGRLRRPRARTARCPRRPGSRSARSRRARRPRARPSLDPRARRAASAGSTSKVPFGA